MSLDNLPKPDPGDLSPEVARFLLPRETPLLRKAVVGAALAGSAGWLAGIISLVLYSGSEATGALLPARVVALHALGNASLVDSAAGAALIGVVSWLLATAFGAVFGVIVARLIGKVGVVTAVGTGIIYGLLLWSVGQFVVLEAFAPNAVQLADQRALLAAHIVYGAILGLLGGWSREQSHPVIAGRLHRLWG